MTTGNSVWHFCWYARHGIGACTDFAITGRVENEHSKSQQERAKLAKGVDTVENLQNKVCDDLEHVSRTPKPTRTTPTHVQLQKRPSHSTAENGASLGVTLEA